MMYSLELAADDLVTYQRMEASEYLKRMASGILNFFHFIETKTFFLISKITFCNDGMNDVGWDANTLKFEIFF